MSSGGTVLRVGADTGNNLNIVSRGVIGGEDYSMTHAIARGARKHGFDSITFASSKYVSGINTVIFDPKKVIVRGILR